jgi:transposase
MRKLFTLLSQEGEEYNALCYRMAEEFRVEVGKAAQILCYAIYHGEVFVDTFSTKQISKTTIIRRKKKQHHSPFKLLWEEMEWDYNPDEKKDSEAETKDNNLKSLDSSESDKYESIIDEREKIVLKWLKVSSNKRTAQWRVDFCNQCGYPERTVYRWVKKYNTEGRNGLMPKNSRAGRPKKFDKKTLELIEKGRSFYLKPGVSLKKAYRKLTSLCKKENIPVPLESSFQWYIYQNTTAWELGKKQGRKYLKSHFTPSLSSFQGAFIPMQIIQMDNTDFDVFPVDSEEYQPLRTPYMTAAIDCYTKMITGFNISFYASSGQNVVEVLVQSILPKNNYSNTYETKLKWLIEGFPVVIILV